MNTKGYHWLTNARPAKYLSLLKFGLLLHTGSDDSPAFVVNLDQKTATTLGYYFGNHTAY
ncbi:hypothetical protein AAY473_030034 [Plecturocebus cupreus]